MADEFIRTAVDSGLPLNQSLSALSWWARQRTSLGLEVTSHIKSLGSWRQEGDTVFSLMKCRSIPPVMTSLVPEISYNKHI